MRTEIWSWTKANLAIGKEGHRRAKKAANVIAEAARAPGNCPVGTVERPMYKTGPYANQPYTARDNGALRDSIRVVERDEQKHGFVLAQFESLGNYGDVRVYAGHYLAYYAAIVEHSNPFMRRAQDKTRARVKDILENG